MDQTTITPDLPDIALTVFIHETAEAVEHYAHAVGLVRVWKAKARTSEPPNVDQSMLLPLAVFEALWSHLSPVQIEPGWSESDLRVQGYLIDMNTAAVRLENLHAPSRPIAWLSFRGFTAFRDHIRRLREHAES